MYNIVLYSIVLGCFLEPVVHAVQLVQLCGFYTYEYVAYSNKCECSVYVDMAIITVFILYSGDKP